MFAVYYVNIVSRYSGDIFIHPYGHFVHQPDNLADRRELGASGKSL